MITRHVQITGRVQGVWYRAWTREEALKLNLDGWVRNCMDGSVEALFHGTSDNVNAMIQKCYSGPAAARIDHITITEATEIPQTGFKQERTL